MSARSDELEAALRGLMHAVDSVLIARNRIALGNPGWSDMMARQAYTNAVDSLDIQQQEAANVLHREAAAPHREDGEGDEIGTLRTMVGKLWEWHRDNYKLAFPLTSKEWGDLERILDSAVPVLCAQPPASDTERQCCKDDCIPGPFHDPDCPKFQDPTQPPEPSDTEGADTLTAGSDNRDVEQVDCPEGSADDLTAVYMTAYYAGKHGENTTYEQMCASIAAEARREMVKEIRKASDKLIVAIDLEQTGRSPLEQMRKTLRFLDALAASPEEVA